MNDSNLPKPRIVRIMGWLYTLAFFAFGVLLMFALTGVGVIVIGGLVLLLRAFG